MSHQKCIKADVVLGLGQTQQLICTEIPLKPPAFEIKDISKEVDVTSCQIGGVVPEGDKQVIKVILNAVLRKNINFKTAEKDHCNDDHDDDDDDDHKDKDGDGGLIVPVRSVCGDVRHCFVEIPFCTLVEVKVHKYVRVDLSKARCHLEQAEVVAQVTEVPRDCDDKKKRTFDRIVEKDVVRIEVKVVQEEQLTIPIVKEGCDLDPC